MKKTPTQITVRPQAASGGATIAERFKLDAIPQGPTVDKKALTLAFSFGLLGLAGAMALTAMLYSHWDFMSNI